MNQTKNFSGLVSLMLAVLIGALPFAAPEACAQALREGLTLCSGPLLLSLYPFLVVSALLIQCPLGDVLALPFRSVAWLVGVYAPCAARVLLVGFLGGFAPAANASAEAVRSGQMTPEEADRLLPACVCSGPSFVILTVGQTLLGSTEVGVLLFLAQITANYLCAALLSRLSRANRNEKRRSPRPKQQEMPQLRLDGILAQSTLTYLKLCGFVLFFRMLAAGAGALLPPAVSTACAMLLEVCSGCDLASRTGYWASTLCCAALSVQGLSVLMQVRTICPPEMTLRPLYTARALHLPLSLAIFTLLLPEQEAEVFSTLPARVILMRQLPPDCAVLLLVGCSFAVCQLTNLLLQRDFQETSPEILTAPGFYDRIPHVAALQDATVAQPVEQLTRNEQVVRSNRISSSKKKSLKVGL